MTELYPLKFHSIFKEKLWGGEKIKSILGKDYGDLDNCGESWELSSVHDNISKVANGALKDELLSDIVARYHVQLVGSSIYNTHGDTFPLLIKFIDSAQNLSVQVHPEDTLAKSRHNCSGKSEMWYIVQADKDASLINGFVKDTNKEEYLRYLNSGRIMKLLHSERVKSGDVCYIPPGRVHTIGKGLLIAEIQQTSDITYRIYDFDRVGKDNKKRELHTDLTLDALNYKKPTHIKNAYKTVPNQANTLASTPYFTTNKWIVNKTILLDRSKLDCFKIYMCVGGSGAVAKEPLSFGEIMLIPATLKEYTIESKSELELLEIYIEHKK